LGNTFELEAVSDHVRLEKKLKHNNFVEFWLDEIAADKFIATHQYGGGIRELIDL
jgi:hypothetical protein